MQHDLIPRPSIGTITEIYVKGTLTIDNILKFNLSTGSLKD